MATDFYSGPVAKTMSFWYIYIRRTPWRSPPKMACRVVQLNKNLVSGIYIYIYIYTAHPPAQPPKGELKKSSKI